MLPLSSAAERHGAHCCRAHHTARGPAAQVQRAPDVVQMRLDGSLGDVQFDRDLSGREPVGDQLDDLVLRLGKRSARGRSVHAPAATFSQAPSSCTRRTSDPVGVEDSVQATTYPADHAFLAALPHHLHRPALRHLQLICGRSAAQPRGHRPRPRAAGRIPREARHHRQLRAAEHRRAADIPHRRRPARIGLGNTHRRRLLRHRMGFAWARPPRSPNQSSWWATTSTECPHAHV